MEKKIALFDMDDTLVDYRGKLLRDLAENMGDEFLKDLDLYSEERIPLVIRQKIKQIRQQKGWWASLPYNNDGVQLWQYFRNNGFETHILTKAPYRKEDSNGWSEKFEWHKIFLPEAENFTETLDKTTTFGNILVDDWPSYVTPWLEQWKDSVAILPVRPYNLDFKHPRAIHYDGKNFKELEKFLSKHNLL
jgi:beta-phosphoglucomutase-like phosphatase (HAD superfamily)